MADKTPDITDKVLDDVYRLVDMWRLYRIVNGPLGVHGEKAKEDLRLYLSGLRQPPTGLPLRKTLEPRRSEADLSYQAQDYVRMLEESFANLRDVNPDGAPDSRLSYLSEYVFDFTTYDGDKSEEFAVRALEVCRAINERKTFEYIESSEGYPWFLLMVNMPFFVHRISWGTSIRGAWWDATSLNKFELDTSELWLDGKKLTSPLKFSAEQWHEFVVALLAFATTVPSTADDLQHVSPKT